MNKVIKIEFLFLKNQIFSKKIPNNQNHKFLHLLFIIIYGGTDMRRKCQIIVHQKLDYLLLLIILSFGIL